MDDQPFYLNGIVTEIGQTFNRYEILKTTNIQEAILLNIGLRPIVTILALNDSYTFGELEVKELLRCNPRTKIVILSMIHFSNELTNIIDAGAVGLLRKNVDNRELENAIRTVMIGDPYYDPAFPIQTRCNMNRKLNSDSISSFTEREKQIIRFILDGRTSSQIAWNLQLTVRTVETYRYKIIKKIGAKNTAELVTYIYKNRLESLLIRR